MTEGKAFQFHTERSTYVCSEHLMQFSRTRTHACLEKMDRDEETELKKKAVGRAWRKALCAILRGWVLWIIKNCLLLLDLLQMLSHLIPPPTI